MTIVSRSNPAVDFDSKSPSPAHSPKAGSSMDPHGSSEQVPSSLSLTSNFGSASASSSKGKKAMMITKDEDYFMESSFMVFQVERCLFRVPSYLFSQESHVFGGMFRLPQPYTNGNGDGDTEGSSEANPIILPDEFTKKDFKCLLKVLYPLSFTLRITLSKEDWTSILKLSTKWYFLNLRKTAISELESLDRTPDALTSLERISLGREYRVSAWLLSGLVDLIMCEQSISDEDALDIDSDYPTSAYKLFRARELRWRGFLTSRAAADKEVESLFKGELSQIGMDEKAYDIPEVEIKLENPKSAAPFVFHEFWGREGEKSPLEAEEERRRLEEEIRRFKEDGRRLKEEEERKLHELEAEEEENKKRREMEEWGLEWGGKLKSKKKFAKPGAQ